MGWTKDGIGPALNPTARSVLSRRERSAAKKPQVAVMTLGAARIQPRDEEIKSYRKTQKIVVGVNGEISGAPLDLGAAGDSNVTAIEFDTSALDWYQSNLENYEATLTFFHSGSTYYTYAFDGKLFSVPSDITIDGVEWQVIFALKEKLDDTTGGNVEEPPTQEVFISQQFAAATTIPSHATYWREEDFETAQGEEERDQLVALAKDTSNAQIKDGDGWLISWDDEKTDSFLGYKKDTYIKQFKMAKPVKMNTFGNWYVSFVNKTLSKQLLFKLEGATNSFAWIIPEITAEASDKWEVSIIARDEINNATYYSNILAATVENNFLQSLDWLIPNKELITVSSNLFSSDDYFFMGSDNLVLTAAMEE